MSMEGGYEYPGKGYGYTMADGAHPLYSLATNTLLTEWAGDEKRGLTSPTEYNHGPHPLIEQASVIGTQVRMVNALTVFNV